ncbi:interferon alpha-inducible protein 27-like protein 2A [Fopius arisanus]|uniref:IFI27 protein n=1 Tax=Fopius arisanus TaxID=64838 RepID=A0A0C9QK62_9HYME|nr:PREDICTED: interferon alpha-inducible protein 27-like protein 2A [Fopius arisanus]
MLKLSGGFRYLIIYAMLYTTCIRTPGAMGSTGTEKNEGKSGGVSWLYVIGGAAGAVVGAPLVVGALGFTSVGITGGSTAAWMMSLSGGATKAGSIVAGLQSIGATGTVMGSTVATAASAATGAVVGAGVAKATKSD